MATKRKDPKDFKKTGRPTDYTPQLADEICDAIASSELGLVHLVNAHPHWPHRGTIFIWMRKHPEFRDKYTLAKEDQQDVCVEYMQEILSEPHKYVDEETGLVGVHVFPEATRLQRGGNITYICYQAQPDSPVIVLFAGSSSSEGSGHQALFDLATDQEIIDTDDYEHIIGGGHLIIHNHNNVGDYRDSHSFKWKFGQENEIKDTFIQLLKDKVL